MDLCSINEIKALLARHGFRFSKSMGQNFLIQSWVPQDIAAASGAGEGSGVLEVGPGIGPLTRELAKRADKVASVELDRSLLPILEETLADCPNAEVCPGDILKTDIPALVGEKFSGLTPLACANLPYNITTPAITALIEAGCFKTITVMIQREVARRICAAPGTADYGAFSVFCQYHTRPELLFDVTAGVFPARPQGHFLRAAHGAQHPASGGGRRGALLPGGPGRLRPAAQDPGQQFKSVLRGTALQGRNLQCGIQLRLAGEYPGRAAVNFRLRRPLQSAALGRGQKSSIFPGIQLAKPLSNM